VVLNTSCSVDHHNCIGSHAQIAPGAHLGGNVVVGEGALIGIGAVVLPQRGVGQWATVGAGAVVTRNIPDFATAVGLPARITGYAVS
jgi:acetyltransferase-like isoleucine patch superfamily enzyme